jgi:general secretion pathway protein M
VSTLVERFEKLEPRERTLLMGLGGTLVLGVVLFLPLYFWRSVSQARDDNQEIRDYLEKVAESREKIAARKAAQDVLAARYAKKMPALASFVEDAAKANGIEISESSAKPDVPHGKKYVEHVLSVRLKQVGLMGLAKTLEKIEKSGFPVALTRLKITPRAGEPDSYDIEMNVSAFERKGEPKKDKPEAEPTEKDEEL